MVGGFSLGLLLLLASFVESSQLNYIKTEVYRSSWSPGQTLEKIRYRSKSLVISSQARCLLINLLVLPTISLVSNVLALNAPYFAKEPTSSTFASHDFQSGHIETSFRYTGRVG